MPKIAMAVGALRQQINCRNKNKILLLANSIAELMQTPEWDEIYSEFLRRELLSLGYTEMLMIIAKNPSMISLSFCEYLPNSYKILHELAYLNESQLIEAIQNGQIEKTMSLTTAKKLRLKSSNSASST